MNQSDRAKRKTSSSTAEKKKKTELLTPPDFERCQAEVGGAFMFGPGRTRCKNKPTMLATEKEPGKDGEVGSMTVCDDCFAAMRRHPAGARAKFELITPELVKEKST